jgi:hypothetical protein
LYKENSLKAATNFAVYYGHNQEKYLSHYDLLILEAKGHLKENLVSLKNNGKIIIAYLSIMEISKEDKLFNLLSSDDFIKLDDEIIENKEYKTFYMDISKDKIQRLLIKRAIEIINIGYDGLFFDTASNIEFLDIPYKFKEKLFNAVKSILQEIKIIFENSILIQNNGIENLCDYTNTYLDGICFENPPYKTFSNFIWTLSAFKKLDILKNEYNIKVLILEEETYNKKKLISEILKFTIKTIAIAKGYLYYKTKQFYTKI